MRLKRDYSEHNKVVGGKYCYDNGGAVPATNPSYWDAVKDRVKEIVGWHGNPIASGNKDEPYEGFGGAQRKATIDKQIDDNGG